MQTVTGQRVQIESVPGLNQHCQPDILSAWLIFSVLTACPAGFFCFPLSQSQMWELWNMICKALATLG